MIVLRIFDDDLREDITNIIEKAERIGIELSPVSVKLAAIFFNLRQKETFWQFHPVGLAE